MPETIQAAAAKFLISKPEVTAVVGEYDLTLKPFIFVEEIIVNLESGFYTPTSAVVLEDGGPVGVGTLTRFDARRLSVNIWATGLRDATGGLVSTVSVTNKIKETFDVLDKYLHRTDPEPERWNSIITISCDRIGSISKPIFVTEGGGVQLATVNYAVYF